VGKEEEMKESLLVGCLIVVSLAVVFLCGGFALGLIPRMKPLYSVGIIVLEGLVIAITLWPEHEDDSYSKTLTRFFIGFVLACAAIPSMAHLFVPKLAAGIVAAIILVLSLFVYVTYLKETKKLHSKQEVVH